MTGAITSNETKNTARILRIMLQLMGIYRPATNKRGTG